MIPARAKPTLLLAPELFGSIGGISRVLRLYLKALCAHAAAHDTTVRFVTLNDRAIDAAQLRRYADDRLAVHLACGGHKLRFILDALRHSHGCGLIVCGHVAQLPIAWAAQKLRPGLRYTLVAHGLEVWRRFSLPERIALRGAERIFCVSEFTRRELLKNCPLSPARLVVLPNPLDPFFAIAPGQPLAACAPVILTVTRLTRADRYKGVDHLIAALPAIRTAFPAATLRIIGHGDDLPRLRTLAQTLGLLDAGVDFAGAVDDARLASEFRACRLFALPSAREGFGLVFLEAMAHGRPCLGALAGGIPEVITPATGLLATYGDVPALAAASIAALRHEWDQDAILARAREFTYGPWAARLGALLPS